MEAHQRRSDFVAWPLRKDVGLPSRNADCGGLDVRPRGTQSALALCCVAFGFLSMQTKDRAGGEHARELGQTHDRLGKHLEENR